jgi:hypothetical protein
VSVRRVARRSGKGGARSAATLRGYELREAKWWAERGFLTDVAWKEARPIGPGKVVWKRRDFLHAYDVIAIKGDYRFAGIQVTATPFYTDERGSDRNAKHGEPPVKMVPPGCTVEEWVGEAPLILPIRAPDIVQVIVSYASARSPDRRWWVQKP